jgi:hypothetical protein
LLNFIVTGLFCPHLIKAFTHLQITNIPSDYIMKRYTRDARTMVPWDRHDIVPTGLGCESDQYKTKKLVEVAMAAVRACRKTRLGFEQGCERLTALAEWGESVARDIEPVHMADCTNEENMTDETGEDGHANRVEQDVANEPGDEPCAPPVPNGIQISECAPKEARTKGRNRGGKQVVNDEASTSKAEGKRRCGYCGSLGHYSTGCGLNPENAGKKRGGSESLRGKMGRKRGRPPTNRQLEQEFDDVA